MSELSSPHNRYPRPAAQRGHHIAALLLVGLLAGACSQATDSPDGTGTGIEAPNDPDTGDRDDDDEASEDGSEEDAPQDDAPDDQPDGDTDAQEPLAVTFDARAVTVTAADGSVVLEWEFPAEDNETIGSVAVRPGAGAEELDAIVATSRGEIVRLYHLGISRETDGFLRELPDHLQPQDQTEMVIHVTWTPDADSVLWTEPTGSGVTLRSFGWEDGPGTGRTADDNASFGLDLPADVRITELEVQSESAWTVLLIDGEGQQHRITLERQSDGALAVTS